MFRKYCLIAVRNIVKNKVTSGIAVLGLAIGMACAILLSLFLNFEFSFDDFHIKKDRIYRVVRKNTAVNMKRDFYMTSISSAIGPLLSDSLHQIESFVRLPGFAFSLCLLL